jgi:hypothetical protein
MQSPTYFNDLKVDLNNESLFPVDIYERTKNNPNPAVATACTPNNDSLDAYANTLSKEILASLKGVNIYHEFN